MMNVMFKFNIGQRVTIRPLNVEGIITGASVFGRSDFDNSVFGTGVQFMVDYRVAYWADSKRTVEWMYEYELSV